MKRSTHRSAFFATTLSLLLVATLPSILHAQGTIPVRGVDEFSSADLALMSEGRSPQSLADTLRHAYVSRGFFDVDVRIDSNVVVVAEGSRYHLDSIAIIPDSLSNGIAGLTDLRNDLEGASATSAAIDDLLRGATLEMSRAGYPLAVARLVDLGLDQRRALARPVVQIEPGDRVTIEWIRTSGNTRTSERLILDAADVPLGTLYSEGLDENVRIRLERLDVFTEVEPLRLSRDDSGRYGLIIPVKEGARNTFDGVVGYQPAAELEENGYFTGLVRIVLRNLFGSGERISGRWEKQTRTTSFLELGYGQPYIFGTPLTLNLRFQQQQEEGTGSLVGYIRREVDAEAAYQISSAWSVLGGGSLESVLPEPDSQLGPCSPRRLDNSSTLSAKAGVQYDSRSNRLNPRNGILYLTTFSVGSKSIAGREGCPENIGDESLARGRLLADLNVFLPIAGPLVLVPGVHVGDVSGDRQEESELFRFGGSGNVRGYREGQFRASRFAWGGLETRLLLSRISHVSAFFDVGWFSRPADTVRGLPAFDDAIHGYGIGLQVDTPVGVARFLYALGEGDAVEEGKVFVGLVGEF